MIKVKEILSTIEVDSRFVGGGFAAPYPEAFITIINDVKAKIKGDIIDVRIKNMTDSYVQTTFKGLVGPELFSGDFDMKVLIFYTEAKETKKVAPKKEAAK